MVTKDETVNKPEKFEYRNWNQWEELVYLYLDSVISKCGAVIRKGLAEDTEWESLDPKIQQIHSVPLEGFMFKIDSKRVLSLLKELCLRNEAETCFRNIKCGS